MRFLLVRLLLFLLPFTVYYGFHYAARRTPVHVSKAWIQLAIAGLVLVAASFVWLGLTQGDSPTGMYVPAHMQNGRVVPGHVEKTKP